MYNMTKTLSDVGIKLQIAAINFPRTMACEMAQPGMEMSMPDMPKCVPNPPESDWQYLLAKRAPGMPVLQDTGGGDIYDEFGGQHDDLFVYDRYGKLFAYLPSKMSADVIGGPSTMLTQDLLTPEGVASVTTIAVLAASSPLSRCYWPLPIKAAAAGSLVAGEGAGRMVNGVAVMGMLLALVAFIAARLYKSLAGGKPGRTTGGRGGAGGGGEAEEAAWLQQL